MRAEKQDLNIDDKGFLIGLVVSDIERLVDVIDDLDLSDPLDLRAYVHHKKNAIYSVKVLDRMYEGSLSALYDLRIITLDTAQTVERFIKAYKREIEK